MKGPGTTAAGQCVFLGRKYKLWKIRHVDFSLLPQAACPPGAADRVWGSVGIVFRDKAQAKSSAPMQERVEFNHFIYYWDFK